MGKFELRTLPPALRILAAGFLLSLGLAYAVALLFVFVRSEMKPAGIAAQYRGIAEESSPSENASANPEPDASGESEDGLPTLKDEWKNRSGGMDFPKSFKEMILTTHLHLLSISMILFLLGGIFSFSSFPEKAKGPVIASGFTALVLTYACMWALRYGSPVFSPGVFLFGLIQAVSMTVQLLAGLRDLIFTGERAKAPV